MKLALKYGRGSVAIDTPPSWTVNVVDHGRPPFQPLEETLSASLDAPLGAPPFRDWAAGKDLLVIVSDVTRYTGAERILPFLLERFLDSGRARILFALGNHRKQTETEQRAIVSDPVFDAVACVDHDCFDDTGLTHVGVTSSGLDVALNSLLFEADGVLVTGAVSHHYLAGFGGGRKCLIPGVAAYRTILDTHKRVFNRDKPGKHVRSQAGVLEGNPMHEAIMEGISLIEKPIFLINTIFDDEKRLLHIFSGDIKASHERGCAWYHENFSTTVGKKADVVIVSAGGYPKDIDFIQSHKALENARHAAKAGGTIILVGRCEDGLGNANFLPWFDYPSSEEMEPYVRESDKVYSQTAYSTRTKAERYRIVLVSDLGEAEVRRMGMEPRKTLDEAIASLPGGSELFCHVIPEGSKTLVREG
ncbi:MAG: nickel-dependent lactate racemase [Syntrophorhabdales bacterium]|jgi:nickel-dependent lactate racemase